MKIVIFFLAFMFLILDIFCNDALLSKFHQNGFKIRDVRVQLMGYDKNHFNLYSVKTFKYNRTTTAHNITANFKVNVEDKIEILVQAYKFLSNEYRYFPLRFQINFSKAFKTNALGIRTNAENCDNLTTIYLYKDITYYLCNFVIDETHLLPLIPDGKYRVDINFLYFK